MKYALIIGASRGIGLGLVRALSEEEWQVTGTVRQSSGTLLHDLAQKIEAIQVEQVDITRDDEVSALISRLSAQKFDLILVNAGIAIADKPVSEVTADEFSKIMLTNAYAPAKLIELMANLLTNKGTLALTSSRQGSISQNTRGDNAVYRASKSALNQLMKSYSAKNPEQSILLLHPGWVKTDLGNSAGQAPLTVTESTAGLVQVITQHLGEVGIQFLDYQGKTVDW
ncbi:SDR family NAD(P)-dependent oxidoreductase [Lactococcus allomyrinae]|uniref:SDR family oxidoreductase n=1 Tax=Lactococcus allomyrinae TaxID=2419773 RepID=A0A387BDF3_9LACT|nr:SDR family NAD(P)-dependent oxidoreductase [Lactococcus allomyrinae]AYG00082.1 SDR family oxidoreductase [Lactococcus allomyrinae]